MFMIVLLPLRGWAGDFMSVQMVTSGPAGLAASTMPPGCPMHAQGSATNADAEATQAPAGMEHCTSCGLCVPLAELADTRLDIITFATHAKPLPGGIDFVSAAPAPTLRPPIF